MPFKGIHNNNNNNKKKRIHQKYITKPHHRRTPTSASHPRVPPIQKDFKSQTTYTKAMHHGYSEERSPTG